MSNALGTTASSQQPTAGQIVLIILDLPPGHDVRALQDAQPAGWKPKRYWAQRSGAEPGEEYLTTYFGVAVRVERIDSTEALVATRDAVFGSAFPGGLTGQDISSVAERLHQANFGFINFQCNPKGVVAFLGDRREKLLWELEHVTLHFTFASSPDRVRIGANDWRDMLRHMRHYYPLVKDLRVCVDEAFWELVDWQRGALSVYRDHFFIRVLHKVAPLEWRTTVHPSWPAQMFCGSDLLVWFGGCDSEEKRAFVYELNGRLELEREDRPVMIETNGDGEVNYVV